MTGRRAITWSLGILLAGVVAPSTEARRVADPVIRRTVLIGLSVEGRPIRAVEMGDPDSPAALVVGCIHGNEQAGIAVTEKLLRAPTPSAANLWVVPLLNPDGAAAATRGNARQVDLNRNFPWRWTRLGGVYASGLRPLSEPETRAAVRLIRRVKPAVSIWFHQHLDAVDTSVGDRRIERRFAKLARLPLAYLTPEPGSAVTWETHAFPNSTSFVVELPAGTPQPTAAARYAAAVRAVAPQTP